MDKLHKRELLKSIGAAGGSAFLFSGVGAADATAVRPESLDDDSVRTLLRTAFAKRPFREMHRFLVKRGYRADWRAVTGQREEIGSLSRPVLSIPFEGGDGTRADCLVRFDERRDVGVQALIDSESYYSSDQLIQKSDRAVVGMETFHRLAEKRRVGTGGVSTQDVKVGCRTVGGAEICAAIAVLGAVGTAGVTLLSPVPGDEAVVLANLGKVEALISGSCGIAELIDGYIGCEPDDFRVCVYIANLFFPYPTIKPLC